MAVTRGKVTRPQKVVVYGPEGIGKSTFASKFPRPVFIDTEGSTYQLDVAREDKPTSWTILLEQAKRYRRKSPEFDTLVIDTADWAEKMAISHLCAKHSKDGIEGFGYGNGFTYLLEEFGLLLNILEEVVEGGTNVVITAHATTRKWEQPDEIGSYDKWELKLGIKTSTKTAPLLKEWADAVLFVNYKTLVVNTDNKGVEKGKNKAQGGKRVMYTEHHPCWDAKNRWGLPMEVDFDYSVIAPHIPVVSAKAPAPAPAATPAPAPAATPAAAPGIVEEKPIPGFTQVETDADNPFVPDGIPKALSDLMLDNDVTEAEIQQAVSSKGYYPANMPITDYADDFINGVLVAAWDKVFTMITEIRKTNQ